MLCFLIPSAIQTKIFRQISLMQQLEQEEINFQSNVMLELHYCSLWDSIVI